MQRTQQIRTVCSPEQIPGPTRTSNSQIQLAGTVHTSAIGGSSSTAVQQQQGRPLQPGGTARAELLVLSRLSSFARVHSRLRTSVSVCVCVCVCAVDMDGDGPAPMEGDEDEDMGPMESAVVLHEDKKYYPTADEVRDAHTHAHAHTQREKEWA